MIWQNDTLEIRVDMEHLQARDRKTGSVIWQRDQIHFNEVYPAFSDHELLVVNDSSGYDEPPRLRWQRVDALTGQVSVEKTLRGIPTPGQLWTSPKCSWFLFVERGRKGAPRSTAAIVVDGSGKFSSHDTKSLPHGEFLGVWSANEVLLIAKDELFAVDISGWQPRKLWTLPDQWQAHTFLEGPRGSRAVVGRSGIAILKLDAAKRDVTDVELVGTALDREWHSAAWSPDESFLSATYQRRARSSWTFNTADHVWGVAAWSRPNNHLVFESSTQPDAKTNSAAVDPRGIELGLSSCLELGLLDLRTLRFRATAYTPKECHGGLALSDRGLVAFNGPVLWDS